MNKELKRKLSVLGVCSVPAAMIYMYVNSKLAAAGIEQTYNIHSIIKNALDGVGCILIFYAYFRGWPRLPVIIATILFSAAYLYSLIVN